MLSPEILTRILLLQTNPKGITETMRKAKSLFTIAILFIAVIAVTTFYYNSALNDKNSQIALMETRISTQNNELANLTVKFYPLKVR